MAIYLGLGSNLGDRHDNLRRALAALAETAIDIVEVSPVVESPAMLPAGATVDWNRPFLNLVAHCRSTLAPQQLLDAAKQIESRLGRADDRRWAPRPIDIDILLYDDRLLDSSALRIPHPGLAAREFFLTPLAALDPGLVIPGLGTTALELNARRGRRIPLWMGIVNLTPDSFSDGGQNASWPAVERRLQTMIEAGVHIIDFGAESTRPGATPLTADAEWSRLAPVLTGAIARLGGDPLRPALSVDTYHVAVAERALALGVDLINDVGGLTDPGMLALAAESGARFVAMHNLGLPADPGRTLATDRSATDQVEAWLDERLGQWQAAGIDLGRIVFDPGIGFGKNPLQSLDLLRNIGRLNGKGLRLLVGHSRKSFLRGFAADAPAERDLVTIGSSMALCARGVDILRVHNVADHALAYRGWAHLQPAD
jgi:2-amino-4-hydroxy-6-hydroxymethyldihydropteridine diphosphokinase/dihydropteroate synthase